MTKGIAPFDYLISVLPSALPRPGPVLEAEGAPVVRHARPVPLEHSEAAPSRPIRGEHYPTRLGSRSKEESQSGQGLELRIVVPPDAIPSAPRPEYFSQNNCGLLGLTKRAYLRLLRRADGPAVIVSGKLRLVKRDHMLAFLDRLAEERKPMPKARALDGADRLLLELGCTPRPAAGDK